VGYDVFLYDKEPEGHLLKRSRHSLIPEAVKPKSKIYEKILRLSRDKKKDAIINEFKNSRVESSESDVSSGTSEDSFKDWLRSNDGKSKLFTNRPQSFGKLSQTSVLLKSNHSPSVTSKISPRSIPQEAFKHPKFYDKVHLGAEASVKRNKLQRLSYLDQDDLYEDKYSMDSELNRLQNQELEEKRIATQAKIAEIMKHVPIYEMKVKKPKRNFLKEAETRVWLPRKPQKETIERQTPKKKLKTRLEIIPMPSELSEWKPLVIRRYCLKKRKEKEAELDSPKIDCCRTCCMLGMGKTELETPLIREMKAKNQKINLWAYYLLWKKREALLKNDCGCV